MVNSYEQPGEIPNSMTKLKVHRGNLQTISLCPIRFSTDTVHNNIFLLIFVFGFFCCSLFFSFFLLCVCLCVCVCACVCVCVCVYVCVCFKQKSINFEAFDYVDREVKKKFHPVDFQKQDYFFNASYVCYVKPTSALVMVVKKMSKDTLN